MQSQISEFADKRRAFHAALLQTILTTNSAGVVSNADSNNNLSRLVAKGIASRLQSTTVAERFAGQTAGNQFEATCADFVRDSFLQLGHLRPGDWNVQQVSGRNRLEIAKYEQYSHLVALDAAAKGNPELAAALGSDYTITPDIIISRNPESDESINSRKILVDESVANFASLREKNSKRAIMHASISCKWTIRSDRAQNARSEALNLIRNRKGRLPHTVVITAEPLPSRLASIALGTGDIDCVYHFALKELEESLSELQAEDAIELLRVMVDGNRLRDIADLPLDLAI